jgi:hypothetical protein
MAPQTRPDKACRIGLIRQAQNGLEEFTDGFKCILFEMSEIGMQNLDRDWQIGGLEIYCIDKQWFIKGPIPHGGSHASMRTTHGSSPLDLLASPANT